LKNLRHKSGEEQKEMNKLKGALEEASMRISALGKLVIITGEFS
jgi:hypothetical protein